MPAMYDEREHIFYLHDILIVLLSLFFSLCSFANAGKADIRIFSYAFDYGMTYGFIFLLIPAFLMFFFYYLNQSKNRTTAFFRMFYIQAFYVLFFKESIALSQLFYGGRSFDTVFASIDYAIFHSQPSVHFHKMVPNNPYITELFFLGYFFYYALVMAGWWVLYFQNRKSEALHALQVVTIAFFIHYIFYIFFPVKGPKFFFPELYATWYSEFNGFLITDFMKGVFNTINIGGAAFPSSHVALSLISLLLNFRYNRFLGFIFLPLTLLLYASTIFIYAHYVIDVVGGLISGLILYFAVPVMIRKMKPLHDRFEHWLSRCMVLVERRFADK